MVMVGSPSLQLLFESSEPQRKRPDLPPANRPKSVNIDALATDTICLMAPRDFRCCSPRDRLRTLGRFVFPGPFRVVSCFDKFNIRYRNKNVNSIGKIIHFIIIFLLV